MNLQAKEQMKLQKKLFHQLLIYRFDFGFDLFEARPFGTNEYSRTNPCSDRMVRNVPASSSFLLDF